MGFKILQHDKYIFFTILYAYIQLYFYILLYNHVTFLIIIEQISVLQITAPADTAINHESSNNYAGLHKFVSFN